MKCMIACILVLAVVVQAEYYNGGLKFGHGRYGGRYLSRFLYAYGHPSLSATQYHAKDELGYAHPGQAATNLRDAFGNQIGTYGYINPEGQEIRVSYTADYRGFRVQSNNLPVGPVDNSVAPLPVQDTPEVPAAKAEIAVKFPAAKDAATPAVRAKRQVFGYGAAPFAYPGYVSPYVYSVAAPAVPVREATLTKTILNPGHATAYRVD